MHDDQAAGLRRLFAHRAARVLRVAEPAWPRRGWLALNLAAAFSRAGEQVLVLDAERENLAGLWGARCRYELSHVLDGDRRLIDVMVPGPESSVILPMRRGGATLARQGRAGQRQLARVLDAFMEHDGLLVVPVSPAKLASPLWRFGGGDLLLCIGEGPVATTGAYASIKAVLAQRPQPSVRVALAGNDTAPVRFEHLGEVVKRFLGATLGFAGGLPAADLADGNPGRTLFDDSPAAARSIEALAHAVAGWRLPQLEFTARPEARRSSAIVTI
jgi:MinD-like ATPase involved in chromosome partitioning or flagellar assembly